MQISCGGKVVLVAGGSGGLGHAVSRAFLAEGAKVVVTYRDPKGFEELKREAADLPGLLEGAQVDVTDEAAVTRMISDIAAKHERLDALVNTVGGYAGGVKMWETDAKTFDLMLDLNLHGRSGLELLKLIRSERPRLPILVFSAQREELYALRAIRAGAMGYLSLRADTDTLLAAMRRVAAGRMFVSSEVTELLANQPASGAMLPHDRLTDREYSIFSRIVSGATLTDIADELSLSIKTISTHKSHILDKMTLAGQVELVRYAIEHKLLDTVSE